MTAITKPGLYIIEEDVYHADPCPEPSASAHALLTLYQRSPRHAWFGHPRLNPHWTRGEPTSEMVFGSAVHALLFDGREVAVVDADSWRTNAAKDARAQAVVAGKIPLLAEAYERATALVLAAKLQLEGHSVTKEHKGLPFAGGQAEVTAIWQRPSFVSQRPLWVRGRIDYWNEPHFAVYDYKTTSGSAHPEAWTRRLLEDGGAFQGVLYPEGVQQALRLDRPPAFRLIVQETEPPYCLCVVELGESARDLASQQVEMAWRGWERAMSTNEWPGYPPEVAAIQAPNWAFYRHQDRAETERAALIANPYLMQ